jgi:hypothetical protein
MRGEGTAGGFDFAAVNGVFFEDVAFSAVPESSATAIGGLVWIAGSVLLRRRRRYSHGRFDRLVGLRILDSRIKPRLGEFQQDRNVASKLFHGNRNFSSLPQFIPTARLI